MDQDALVACGSAKQSSARPHGMCEGVGATHTQANTFPHGRTNITAGPVVCSHDWVVRQHGQCAALLLTQYDSDRLISMTISDAHTHQRTKRNRMTPFRNSSGDPSTEPAGRAAGSVRSLGTGGKKEQVALSWTSAPTTTTISHTVIVIDEAACTLNELLVADSHPC